MSSQRGRAWGLAVLVSLFLPTAARAQASASSPEAVLARIESGKVVRARLDPDRTLVGSYAPVGDGRLGIRSDLGATDTLRLGEIRELAIRGRHTKTGAIVGGMAGVGLGIFIGWIVTNTCDAADCDGSGPYAVAIPLFGGGGALLGAAIGTAIPRWKRVFP